MDLRILQVPSANSVEKYRACGVCAVLCKSRACVTSLCGALADLLKMLKQMVRQLEWLQYISRSLLRPVPSPCLQRPTPTRVVGRLARAALCSAPPLKVGPLACSWPDADPKVGGDGCSFQWMRFVIRYRGTINHAPLYLTVIITLLLLLFYGLPVPNLSLLRISRSLHPCHQSTGPQQQLLQVVRA
eukprot:72125-Rhodomonas_salina.1